jgi:poly-gamma-glutamate synthesis protein (capsule biosynthesis protein)
MNLLIGGDLFVSDRYRGNDLLDPALVARFAAADFRIINLEAPIIVGAKKQRILKTGPHLFTAKETILPLLTKLGVDLVTLANNHIMDLGLPGLRETLQCLDNAGIRTVGAGLDLEEAVRPFVFEKDGTAVAILNFGENEWASAEPGQAGANPLDVIANIEQIREAKKTSEFVIVIIHGGMEDYPYPTPRMVRQYRFYAENGASVVVGHHPHCLSGYEIHAGSPIFYSLGNFLFTLPSVYATWYTGLVLSLQIQKGQGVSWELIPIAQDKLGYNLTRLAGESLENVRGEIEEYARTIADEAALDRRWNEFLNDHGRYYLKTFNPVNAVPGSLIRRVLFRLRVDRLLTRKGHYAEILNTLRCESHAEAARQTIERILK